MNDDEMKRPVEWAGRVNRRWIVHHGLGQRAEEWLAHLAAEDPRRLARACETARAMVRGWDEAGDPKPWFYSGLFHSATKEEAKRFLSGHRLTTATVPSMADDPEVVAWEESLCAETNGLLERLRKALTMAAGKKRGAEKGL